MKLRYITLIFTTLIAIFLGITLGNTQSNPNTIVDVVKINESYQEILVALQAEESINQIEETFECHILLRSDADYESKVMEAIRNSKIILDYEQEEEAILIGKIVFSGDGDLINSMRAGLKKQIFQTCICLLLIGYLIIGLIYYFYIRPFAKLQQFAANVAKGNLGVPLSITKENYFGVFTESFDIMREELILAKQNEYKANVSKKELVAELSHDMKTPIATIKATCEVLKLKAKKNNDEETKDMLSKVNVIEKKSDMIDQLIGNMFHATLEELENLKVEPIEEPSTLIADLFHELRYYETIQIKNSIPECLVYMDVLRFKQVIDNIVNNSYKYAGTQIDVLFKELDAGIIVEIRDYGAGVKEDELPLITEKFFRGKNGKGKSGAGLGLFLAKYFMDNMKGAFECFNDNGFVVNLFIRKVV